MISRSLYWPVGLASIIICTFALLIDAGEVVLIRAYFSHVDVCGLSLSRGFEDDLTINMT